MKGNMLPPNLQTALAAAIMGSASLTYGVLTRKRDGKNAKRLIIVGGGICAIALVYLFTAMR